MAEHRDAIVLTRARPTRVVREPKSVVLVHGILGNRHAYWNLFRRRLERDGFAVTEANLPYSLLGDIRIAARRLDQTIRQTAGQGRVDVVCHSAGGLAARYAIKFLGTGSHVRKLILLATPHRGTYFSFTMPLLRIARQARPGARILSELGDDTAGVEVVNFWSPVDGIVVPAHSSVLPGARNIRVDWMHHWAFLVSPSLYTRVRAVLEEA